MSICLHTSPSLGDHGPGSMLSGLRSSVKRAASAQLTVGRGPEDLLQDDRSSHRGPYKLAASSSRRLSADKSTTCLPAVSVKVTLFPASNPLSALI